MNRARTQSKSVSAQSLFVRHAGNPILSAANWPEPINAVFNPAAVRRADGSTTLLCRVEDATGRSSLIPAHCDDGISGWRIDLEHAVHPQPDEYPEELHGIEDPRVVWIDELQHFVICYTSFAESGPCVSIMTTPDFRDYDRLGVVLPPENKDASLFPQRIGSHWLMLHRPVSPMGSADIWIGSAKDLRHWGEHRCVMRAKHGCAWDAAKIGLGPPPLLTDRGWLIMYHGVRETAAGGLYRVGLALLDPDDPSICIRRSSSWVFGPSEDYERRGDVPNVVFPCGWTVGDDGDTLNVYYGAADSSIGLATGSLLAALDWLDHNSAC